jgi:hypothetical protein
MAVLLALLTLVAAALGHLPQERDITMVVGPGKEECFFEELVKGNTLTVEYQVRAGTVC